MDCSLSNLVSSLVSCGRPVWRLALSSCRLIACSYRSHLVPWSVSSGISFLISFYPRAALLIVSSCRLAEASCLLVSFSFHPSCLRRLADLDMAFLRGCRATVSSRWACGSPPCGLRLAPYLLATKPLCGVRARPASSGHEAARTAKHGDNDEMSWTKRRDRKTGGTSGKTETIRERDDEAIRHDNETGGET